MAKRMWNVLAPVAIGGMVLGFGGCLGGGVWRTVIGVLIITVLRVGLGIMGVDPAYTQIVYGVVLAVAVALTIDRTKLSSIK